MAAERWDVLVIGGGIVGAGIAWDASRARREDGFRGGHEREDVEACPRRAPVPERSSSRPRSLCDPRARPVAAERTAARPAARVPHPRLSWRRRRVEVADRVAA